MQGPKVKNLIRWIAKVDAHTLWASTLTIEQWKSMGI